MLHCSAERPKGFLALSLLSCYSTVFANITRFDLEQAMLRCKMSSQLVFPETFRTWEEILFSIHVCDSSFFRMESLLGYKPMELYNKSMFEFHHALDSAALEKVYSHCKYPVTSCCCVTTKHTDGNCAKKKKKKCISICPVFKPTWKEAMAPDEHCKLRSPVLLNRHLCTSD